MPQTLELDKKNVQEMRSTCINYFEQRLRNRNHTLIELFPSLEMVGSSQPLEPMRKKLGQEYELYLNAVIDGLLEEGAISRYSDKFPNRADARKFPNHFSYAGDLEIIADEHLKAIRSGDY